MSVPKLLRCMCQAFVEEMRQCLHNSLSQNIAQRTYGIAPISMIFNIYIKMLTLIARIDISSQIKNIDIIVLSTPRIDKLTSQARGTTLLSNSRPNAHNND